MERIEQSGEKSGASKTCQYTAVSHSHGKTDDCSNKNIHDGDEDGNPKNPDSGSHLAAAAEWQIIIFDRKFIVMLPGVSPSSSSSTGTSR